MKLVVLGAPGAGKGTQGKNLSKHFEIAHISTGDVLRSQIERKTDIGMDIQDKMKKGELISDDIVIPLLKERTLEHDCKNGFILDGFPRNLTQAEVLNDIFGDFDKAISIEVSDDIILERMTGRISCPKCNTIYHTAYYPPAKEMICDKCSITLIQREDDKAETVLNRLKVYHETTEPIIDFYRNKNILITISGVGEVSDITDAIVKAIEV